MKNIIFIAPPAAGKGTQSELLQQKYQYTHISTGDMLRQAILENSLIGQEVKAIMEKGNLVPDEIIIALIEKRLNEKKDLPFILDGFPRTLTQALSLDNILNNLNLTNYVVIYLDINEKLAKQRILGRLTCGCGKSFNIYDEKLKPKIENICDSCGKTLIKRSDDNEESFKMRFNNFLTNNQPILDFYQNKNKLVKIDVNRDFSFVHQEILKVINND